MHKSITIAGALIVLGLLAFCGCTQKGEYRSLSGNAWGTTYHITYQSPANLDKEILDVIQMVDASLSPFNPNSNISAINSSASQMADSRFRDVFSISQRICSISGGAFDPTVAPLVNLWGFGYKDADSIPDSTQIARALASVGILECNIDADGRVTKKNPDTEFNFSAIAKGYGVDQVASLLRDKGCENFMVEIGGELSLAGKNRHGEKWRIQVDAPDMDLRGVIEHNRLDVLSITDCGIATSGNYRNFRLTDDGYIGHTISPTTGMPVTTRTLSATIIAPTCAEADALATATMAMPDSAAARIINSLGFKAILVIANESDAGYSTIRIGI